jgi:hypothetical protein
MGQKGEADAGTGDVMTLSGVDTVRGGRGCEREELSALSCCTELQTRRKKDEGILVHQLIVRSEATESINENERRHLRCELVGERIVQLQGVPSTGTGDALSRRVVGEGAMC